MKINKKQKWRVDLDQLTPRQLARYEKSLEVLSLMRHGNSIRKASHTIGISVITAKKYLGNSLYHKGNRTTARKTDSLLRKMLIYENGRQIWIQLRGKKKARIIGRYHSAIARLVEEGDISRLESFSEIKIRDFKNKSHRFVTDTNKILEILQRIEEPEFFRIYTK
ncbi:MAG TPA: hypothetical protein VGR54_02845 [Nitrosopumilaceae archaeon]|nr:hypothetical protein [Nitrosopumilaceae archaeon]